MAVRIPQEMQSTGPKPQLAFGHGTLVVSVGSLNGQPAVFIAPAKMPGAVGQEADRENVPKNAMADGEIAWTFPTDAQAQVVADAICGVALSKYRSA